MQAIIKGSFSVSSSSNIIIAMMMSGSFKKGDQVICPMKDGSTRTLLLKGIETLAPAESSSQLQYPIALIVDPLQPAEVAVGGSISLCPELSPKTPAAPIPASERPATALLPSRKIS